MSEATDAPRVLEARGISKRFPGVLANDKVGLVVHKGEIVCLLGENGAGKSTLMNVVYGLYHPDEGELLVNGKRVVFTSSADAIRAGIGMVHQHFQLVPVLTVAENVVLGHEIRKGPFLDLARARREVAALSKEYGLAVDPDARVEELSVGAQQRVELIKALYRNADILILDEPTAVLTPAEVDHFFGVVRSLVEAGKSVVFITHKLREVLAVADTVTVLRGGKVVGTADPKTATEESLASLMVGRDVVFEVPKGPAHPGHVILSVRELHVADDRGVPTVDGVHLEVRAGEILGVAGVEGNGQRELVEAVAGMRPPVRGHIQIEGHDIGGWSPRRVTQLGVGHVPEDRAKHGLVGTFSVADNLMLNRYNRRPFSRRLVFERAFIRDNAQRGVKEFDIRTPSVDTPAGSLSGGNQQKVVVARELSGDVKLLVVAQPTRGLDVGSVEFIHTQIIQLRDGGAAVLLVSAELDEILALSDRIAVIYRGRVAAVVPRPEATREGCGLLMAGAGEQAPAAPT
ncbi:MAG: ATP-binding cassette domain-containing protein [Nitriliruptorales bacterium]|nr:ATP-binding cassette domain-containing protein [Nitriliruptorales bacterium]